MKLSKEEKKQLKEGREYLDKLLKSGEIDEEAYASTLKYMKEGPKLFTEGTYSSEFSSKLFGANSDELLPFGGSYKEVLKNDTNTEPHQLLSNLSAIIMYKEQHYGMESLTQEERYIYVVDGMLTEVNNGGFGQFFFNSTGELAYDLLPALKAIGSIQFKAIASKAVDIFGEIPSLDEDSRYSHLGKITENDELQIWDECDDEFYDCEEEIESMAIAYAKHNLI